MLRRSACLMALAISILGCGLALAQPAPQPQPAPIQRITLNDRIFLGTADVYDPTYGLLRIGYIKDNVLTFLPLNKQIRNFPMPAPQSRNFTVYSYHSDEGVEGDVSIPVIGSAHASKDQVVYANMEDISEVYAPPGHDLSPVLSGHLSNLTKFRRGQPLYTLTTQYLARFQPDRQISKMLAPRSPSETSSA